MLKKEAIFFFQGLFHLRSEQTLLYLMSPDRRKFVHDVCAHVNLLSFDNQWCIYILWALSSWSDEPIDTMDKSGNQLIWTERYLRRVYWISRNFCALITCSMYRFLKFFIFIFSICYSMAANLPPVALPPVNNVINLPNQPQNPPVAADIAAARQYKKSVLVAHGKLWCKIWSSSYVAPGIYLHV